MIVKNIYEYNDSKEANVPIKLLEKENTFFYKFMKFFYNLYYLLCSSSMSTFLLVVGLLLFFYGLISTDISVSMFSFYLALFPVMIFVIRLMMRVILQPYDDLLIKEISLYNFKNKRKIKERKIIQFGQIYSFDKGYIWFKILDKNGINLVRSSCYVGDVTPDMKFFIETRARVKIVNIFKKYDNFNEILFDSRLYLIDSNNNVIKSEKDLFKL